MSTGDKNDPARGWLFAEGLLAEEDDERLACLSPEERQAELERRGMKPATQWNAREMIAAATARAAKQSADAAPVTPEASPPAPPVPAAPPQKLAPVIPIRKTWRNVALWAAAAAGCVGFLVLLVVQSRPNIAGHHRRHSDRDLAEADRDMAEASCALKDWAACKDRLDEAARLDPDGESEPRVQKARAEIAIGVAGHPVDAGGTEKPGP